MQAVRERLIQLDPTPLFKWFDDVLDTGGQTIAFNMGLKTGEQIMASIIKRQGASQNEALREAVQVLYCRGFGRGLIPLRDNFSAPSLKISITEPPTDATKGSFVAFLAGGWAGVVYAYSGRRYAFAGAVRSGSVLSLRLTQHLSK